LTLDDLNAMDRDAFVGAIGWVFEHSPWIAERAWPKRPFATLDGLHDALVAEVASADSHQQLQLLQAHPELGTSAALSPASDAEQTGAGLRQWPQFDRQRLQTLTSAYRAKFGFPFLYAVRGATAESILNALEARLASTRDAESAEALRQAARIARFRLEDLIS
jgi:2-oxo-4-hydroxy-4-carboxy-5-ureidoimidazoline decarboxylase